MTIVSDIYMLSDKLVVDIYKNNRSVESLDTLLNYNVSEESQRIATRSIPADTMGIATPQNIFSAYTRQLNNYVKQDSIENWYSEEDRLVNCLPVQKENIKDAYKEIVSALQAREI